MAVMPSSLFSYCLLYTSYFRETDAKLYDGEKKAETVKHVMPGTVIVDPNVAFQRNLGAYNNTIVHECVHWELHKKAFALERCV